MHEGHFANQEFKPKGIVRDQIAGQFVKIGLFDISF